jgi:UDP-glucose 4-epimerase
MIRGVACPNFANVSRQSAPSQMDGRVVNIVDDAPTSIYELAELVGETIAPSAEPLANPWYIHADGSLARSLGFKPIVRTIYQAVQEKLM